MKGWRVIPGQGQTSRQDIAGVKKVNLPQVKGFSF
jgi:hypothetical protein